MSRFAIILLLNCPLSCTAAFVQSPDLAPLSRVTRIQRKGTVRCMEDDADYE